MVSKDVDSDSEVIAYTVETYGDVRVISSDLRTLSFAISREQIPDGSYKIFNNGTDMSILYR
jgi:hypothetical protein